MIRSFQSLFSSMPPVVKNLLIINVLIWLVMALLPAADYTLTRHLALYYFTSPGFEPYQLITYMFLHGSFGHLFFNMFALFIFGRTIEQVMGSARFLFYYFTCGICAALVQQGVFAWLIHDVQSLIGDAETCRYIINEGWYGIRFGIPEAITLNSLVNTPMVGASGAIYGVLLAFGFLFPNTPV